MKIKFILLLVLISVNSWLFSTTWHINQDGSGDFLTIMEGVNAAAENDTIRVHQGTYFENIVIEQNLSLVSNYEYTGNDEDIYNTILDGNWQSSVIRLMGEENDLINVYICGFVIQHGIGWDGIGSLMTKDGGGLLSYDSSLTLKKNTIINNKAYAGGGIYLRSSTINLLGNEIINNTAYSGGGIIAMDTSIVFDPDYLNDIYLNYAGKGAELRISTSCPPTHVILDTFTVIEPDFYFLYSYNMYGYYQPNEITYDIQNAKIEQVEHDLYVAADGSDDNSGLTPADPLQNIHYALTLIKADSLNHRTIHVADGLYSPSENNQYFPLHMKSYVSLIGESRENTILDAEGGSGFVVANDILESWVEFLQRDWTVQNFKMVNNSYEPAIGFIQKNHNVLLKNIEITGFAELPYCSIRSHFTKIDMDNIYTHDILCGLACFLSSSNGYTVNLTNFKIDSMTSNEEWQSASGFWIDKNASSQPEFVTNIINAQIFNNDSQMIDWTNDDSAIRALQGANVNLINSTICDNTSITGGAIVLHEESELNIYNSILYGNSPLEIVLDGSNNHVNTLSVQNSLVEGGVEGILEIGYNIINWVDNNLDEDPLFVGVGENPYALSESSPCIDAGTLELPEGVVMPTYDLAGNPRICGSAIDMGCYEYGGNAAPIYLEVNGDTLSWSIPQGHFPNYYAIYLNEELLETITGNIAEYTFPNLVNGQTYTAGVSAVYGIEETAIIEISFDYEEVEAQDNVISAETTISNFPNPFNPSTKICLNLSGAGKTKLAIYNIKGQRVKKLINAYLEKGQFNMEWHGKDENGKKVASGQYFLKLEQNGKITATKMMLLK